MSSSSASLDRLFHPLKLGHSNLSHRIIMAPLTRFRADANHNPSPLAAEYYSQRASSPGTLIITEATFISARCGGYKKIPGIWSQDQINGWKEIVREVKEKNNRSQIWLQLWALGRVAQKDVLESEKGGPFKVSAPSPIGVDSSQTNAGAGMTTPSELSESSIREIISEYATAAKNAISAGFDGVEIHGANGYLIDQFWQDVSNQRSDSWGGSVENRARFGLEVTIAVIEAVGGDTKKVGMRLSPWGKFQGMGMQDPVPQFSHVIQELKKLDLAYLSLIESRVSGSAADGVYNDKGTEELKKFVQAWGEENPIILAGGFTPEKAAWAVNEVATGSNVAIAFGRYFISTPDLPFRIQKGLELNKWDRKTFYAPDAHGYTDYEFSEEWRNENEGSGSRL